MLMGDLEQRGFLGGRDRDFRPGFRAEVSRQVRSVGGVFRLSNILSAGGYHIHLLGRKRFTNWAGVSKHAGICRQFTLGCPFLPTRGTIVMQVPGIYPMATSEGFRFVSMPSSRNVLNGGHGYVIWGLNENKTSIPIWRTVTHNIRRDIVVKVKISTRITGSEYVLKQTWSRARAHMKS